MKNKANPPNVPPEAESLQGNSSFVSKPKCLTSLRILGIDPGSIHTGYGIINYQDSKIVHLGSGRISPKSDVFPERLLFIFENLKEIIALHRPECMVLETVFTYKNPDSALKLAQARGVAILSGSLFKLPIIEYTPNQVKNSVCGYGRAEKSQVAFMTGKILNITEKLPPDTSDALAVAICHAGFVGMNKLLDTKPKKKANKNKSFRNLTPEDLISLGLKISSE